MEKILLISLELNFTLNTLDSYRLSDIIFQSLKLRYLMGKILRIFPKLNFSQNTLGYYGLI